jgi:hypothetical protein
MTACTVDFDRPVLVAMFLGPPEKQPWGEFAKFKDPDGNQFVLSSSG